MNTELLVPKNLTVNYPSLAQGIYDMMNNSQRIGLRFGLIPANVIEAAIKTFRDLLADRAAKMMGVTDEPTIKSLSDKLDPKCIADFHKGLTVALIDISEKQR